MNKMKYIVYDNGMYSAPVIFPDSEDHGEFAFRIVNKREDVLSAGFVEIVDGKARAFGRSTSLQLEADSERDSHLINRMLGNTDDF
jgi:hypothetical protein